MSYLFFIKIVVCCAGFQCYNKIIEIIKVLIFFQLNKEIMEPLTNGQKSILTDTYMSRYNAYTTKNDLFETLTVRGKKTIIYFE